MNTYDNTGLELDARDFLGGYLKKEDLDGETAVTIIDVRAEEVPGNSRRKLVVEFREFEKPLILNSTNIKRLAAIFGSTKTSAWRGTIALYVDDTVEFGGTTVGGIRVLRAVASEQAARRVGDGGRVNGGVAA